jgi:hypothetical protein
MYLEDALAQDVHRRRQADATVAHRVAAARQAADARQDADTLAAEPLPGEPLPVERPSARAGSCQRLAARAGRNPVDATARAPEPAEGLT